MKRRWILWLAALGTAVLLVGCGGEGAGGPILQPAFPLPVADPASPEEGEGEGEGQPSSSSPADASGGPEENIQVDVDLTALSSTMVYGEVYQMMTRPEDYLGKVIRLRGQYYASYADPPGEYYHFAIITDALACCVQGIEFSWIGEHTYPDDYPGEQAEIEITGVFERFQDQGGIYYRIAADQVKVL